MIRALADSLLPFTSWLLFASLKCIAIIPLVLILRRLCARWLSPQGRYGLWLAVIACLCIPFGAQVQMADGMRSAAAPLQPVSQPANAEAPQPLIGFVETPVTIAATSSKLSTASKFVLAWLAGVTVLTVAVLYNTVRYRRIVCAASAVAGPAQQTFGACVRLLNIPARVRILETSRIASPVVIGWWRPTLLLPRNLAAHLGSQQLRLVLLHELTHVRRHDILMNWLITLVQIAHWFNPLVWYALRKMRDDMEHACDASVLRHLSPGERLQYGSTLISLSDLAPQRALLAQNASVIESRSQLKARISMIARYRSRGAASRLLAATLIAVTSFVAVTQAAEAPRQGAGAAPPLQSAGAPESGPDVEPGSEDSGRAVANDAAYTGEVRDSADRATAMPQVVETQDIPLEEIAIDVMVAWVDEDLPGMKWGALSSSILESGEAVIRQLEAAHRSNRAEIVSTQRVTVANRSLAYLEQGNPLPWRPAVAGAAQERGSQLRIDMTPEIQPDGRVRMDVKISFNKASDTTFRGARAISTSELGTQIVLASGATAVLGGVVKSERGRPLIVFVTPKLSTPPAKGSMAGHLEKP